MNTIDLHIIDIIQNSLRAGAGEIGVSICKTEVSNTLRITISDNGSGIEADKIASVCDPYFTSRTERKVGLGLTLLKFQAELTGGYLVLESTKNRGTSVEVCFNTQHPDCQPAGDISGTLARFVCQFPDVNFGIEADNGIETFHTSSRELKEALGNEGSFSKYDFALIKELLSSYVD